MDEMPGVAHGARPLVVLHERTGCWARRIRPRIDHARAAWIETRSRADLLEAITGATSPVVLVEVGPDPERTLGDLAEVQSRCSDALILVLDPAERPAVRELAAEFGAVHVASGNPTPPEVAGWLGRWIALAADRIVREGWTRAPSADPIRDPVAWLAEQDERGERSGPARDS